MRIALTMISLCLFTGSGIRAEPPAGNWQLNLPIPQGTLTFLFSLSPEEGKWVGRFLDSEPELQQMPAVVDVRVYDKNIELTFDFDGEPLTFDGKRTPKGTIQGTLPLGGSLELVELQPSKLKNLDDSFAVAREALARNQEGSDYFTTVLEVLSEAADREVPLAEVRSIADQAIKKAAAYGNRWQRTIALQLASTLADAKAYQGVALEQARRAQRMLKPTDPASVQINVLETLAQTMRKTGQTDQLRRVEAMIEKFEARDYQEYAKTYPGFKPQPFAGRKVQSDRAVLVELFTGAECPPCVAADLGFDALEESFKPSEVVLLQYHLHIPAPDALTNPASLSREEYYNESIRGTPTIFFDGNADDSGGGFQGQAEAKYELYRGKVIELLNKPAKVNLKVAAQQQGETIRIKAMVQGVGNPGPDLKLRFALAEEKVRYTGGNGLRYHHCVVRNLPGGAAGFAITKPQFEQTVKVDLGKLRAEINKYLDGYEKQLADEGESFSNPSRPMKFAKLHVVAFVQDDKTKQVLQAAQVEIGGQE